MKMDEILIAIMKAKILEGINTFKGLQISKGHILDIIETAKNEITQEIKEEMWHDVYLQEEYSKDQK